MKILKILLGPEISWIVLYVLSICLAWANKKSSYVYDGIIENLLFAKALYFKFNTRQPLK